jgi:ketosteroid isomerase-like protein
MDHAVTLGRLYGAISDHDVDAFGGLLAEGFVEHEMTPGLQPTKDGAKDFFRMQLAAFPDLAMTVEDVIDGGDKLVARVV